MVILINVNKDNAGTHKQKKGRCHKKCIRLHDKSKKTGNRNFKSNIHYKKFCF